MNQENNANKKSGLATAGLVLGIVGICLSFIPILNNASFFLGILALIFGIVSLVKKTSKGKVIASLVLGILSVVITLSLQSSWSNTLDDISNDLDNISGDNTEEVLNYVDINIGSFEVVEDTYFNDTKLTVKITNKTNEKKSFSITIEAASSDGTRIDTDYIYANDLLAGQSQSFDLFTYISDDDLDEMKKAKFNIVEASMY